jgi:putative phosphoribosyl transferase
MPYKELVGIFSAAAEMEGVLEVPDHARGVVLFAHGSGSSRLSPRNNYVASVLRRERIGTLLLDLLTPEEDLRAENRFNIDLLTHRLGDAASWLRSHPPTDGMPLGLFGASTGAAAALRLAAEADSDISAVVSRGGRPDLAGRLALAAVRAPTLLIVGGDDGIVVDLNRKALAELRGEADLIIIPGATHLFEEPGALEQVAEYAAGWFENHFPPRPA